MYTDPKKNRTQPALILVEQFRHKGYQCEEIREEDSTILILKHDKKVFEMQVLTENHKKFFKAN